MAGMDRYEYFACDGGPHLLLPRAFASEWKGVENPDDVLDPTTDYGRACAASDAVTAIEVADGQALVLGQSPPMTAWAHACKGKGVEVYILESWGTGELDALIDQLREAPASASQGSLEWVVPDGGVVLMFAGDTVERTVYGVKNIARRTRMRARASKRRGMQRNPPYRRMKIRSRRKGGPT
jgi:hypothetical protein